MDHKRLTESLQKLCCVAKSLFLLFTFYSSFPYFLCPFSPIYLRTRQTPLGSRGNHAFCGPSQLFMEIRGRAYLSDSFIFISKGFVWCLPRMKKLTTTCNSRRTEAKGYTSNKELIKPFKSLSSLVQYQDFFFSPKVVYFQDGPVF